MTRRVADLLAWRGTGMLTDEQIIAELRRLGVDKPEALLADPNVPDPSSAGFEQRIQPYIAPSPTLRWLR